MNTRPLQYALSPLTQFGLADPIVEAYSEVSGRYDHLDGVDPEIANFELAEEDVKGEILMPLIHTQGKTVYLYVALAHAFRCRGYRPIITICNSLLPICLQKEGHPDTAGTCSNCHHESKTYLESFGFEPTYLSDYLPDSYDVPTTNETEVEPYVHNGVDLSTFSVATTRRFLRKYTIDFEDENDRDIYNRFLQSGIMLTDAIKNVLSERDIAATVGSHIPYVYGGALEKLSYEENIPAINYGTGYFRKNTVFFGHIRNRRSLNSDPTVLKTKVEEPLTDAEMSRIDSFMEGRRNRTVIRDRHNYIENADKQLPIDEDRPIIGLFCNLLWDGSLIGSDLTFDSPFEWVKQTIDFVNDQNLHLVIKAHPAEAHRETNERMVDWIRNELEELPSNVTLLEADTSVDPYKLADDIDLGIVYNSTLGLEMTCFGKPVIVVGETHYRNLGFTYDPETDEEYFNLLSNLEEVQLDREMKQRAKRYANYLIFGRHIEFKFANLEGPNRLPDLRHEELNAGNEKLDYVVDRILSDDGAIAYEEDSAPITETQY
ncbi:hypothetical protein EGO51_11340 [Haloarcula hispanica]|uniref:Capsule polysaccharide biosynthesis protein n=1 Tax=Haloarcula hispanica TaxID=51589 RepID=A0A5J5LLL1_HALHI|nr:hypothetical protein [Haloarcula hispanica]KAA9410370.1 hypothetical protein EGO51_11340 [Haloarcula hispanica]